MQSSRLGEILVTNNLITREQLTKALEEQKMSGGQARLGSILVKQKLINEQDLSSFLSKQYGVPTVNLSDFDIDPAVTKIIQPEVVQKYQLVPINRAGSTLIVAVTDPSNLFAIEDIKFMTGYNVEMVVATESDIKNAIDKYYDQSASLADVMGDMDLEDLEVVDIDEEIDMSSVERATEDAPVVRMVNAILQDAIKKKASDIHIEPYEKLFRVRYRIDGVLYEAMKPPLKLKNAITSRIKIMAELDIAERRLPQDGRIKIKLGGGRDMDFRVSVLPTLFGEKICLRLLDKSSLQTDLTKLGYEPEALEAFQREIHKPFGMVLVTGPTGSGKTVTLYSTLKQLATPEVNVCTLEDPIEMIEPSFNQVQVLPDIGMGFAEGIRSLMRQDPDIIMVGEIRDLETGDMAIQAALTGHLVLSTLHTNDAPSAMTRLLDLGVPPYLLSATVLGVMAQRLVRTLCPHCKEPGGLRSEDEEAWNAMVAPWKSGKPAQIYRPVGCLECRMTGFLGRIGIYEIMPMSADIRKLVAGKADLAKLREQAMREGMKPLRIAGAKKVAAGLTTIAEIIKVAPPISEMGG